MRAQPIRFVALAGLVVVMIVAAGCSDDEAEKAAAEAAEAARQAEAAAAAAAEPEPEPKPKDFAADGSTPVDSSGTAASSRTAAAAHLPSWTATRHGGPTASRSPAATWTWALGTVHWEAPTTR